MTLNLNGITRTSTFLALFCLSAVAMTTRSYFFVPSVNKGDVFAAVGDGKVKHFHPDGTLVSVLDTDLAGGETAGMAFDATGNLFATHFTGSQVFKFAAEDGNVQPFGSGYDASPESIVLNENGDLFIGQADGSQQVLSFSASGELLATYSPETERRGTDWIELAADQKTLFYTSEGVAVKRYDLTTQTQLPDFNIDPLPGSIAYALRILPQGGVIVADTEMIVRLDADGSLIQTYDAPDEDYWFAVNLDPDGQTFWSGNLGTGQVYRFDIESGTQLATWSSQAFTSLGGLTVYGEITVAQPFTLPRIPIWLPLVGIGLPILLLAWLLWRRGRKPKRRPTAPTRPSAPPPSRPQVPGERPRDRSGNVIRPD